jgi:hypothetical protein
MARLNLDDGPPPTIEAETEPKLDVRLIPEFAEPDPGLLLPLPGNMANERSARGFMPVISEVKLAPADDNGVDNDPPVGVCVPVETGVVMVDELEEWAWA